MIKDFYNGAGCFIRGLKVLKVRGIRKFAVIPLIVNAVVYTGALIIGSRYYEKLLSHLLPEEKGFLFELARASLWLIFAACVLLILFFTFNLMANLIGSPFNGLLSSKVELVLYAAPGEMGKDTPFLATILPSILSELRKFIKFMILSILLFLLSWVPVVNIVSPFLWALFTSWMMAVEYLSYPMEGREKYFREVRNYIGKRRSLTLGFGVAVVAASMVPLFNFLVMPAAVAGATILYMENPEGT